MNAIRGRLIGPGDSTRAGIRQPAPAPAGAPVAPVGPQPVSNKRRDFFAYTITFANLLAGASAQGSLQLQSDSEFELTKLTMFADIAADPETAATRVLPLVTLQMRDSGTARNLFSAPVPIPAIFGDGQIPFILPVPKLFSPNASISFEVSNFAAATDYNLRLLLVGAKVFAYG
jgi:hypothetical protein